MKLKIWTSLTMIQSVRSRLSDVLEAEKLEDPTFPTWRTLSSNHVSLIRKIRPNTSAMIAQFSSVFSALRLEITDFIQFLMRRILGNSKKEK